MEANAMVVTRQLDGVLLVFSRFEGMWMVDSESTPANDDGPCCDGATAVVPYSQRKMAWPKEDEFTRDHQLVTGKRGTVLMFTGLLQHGSTTNNTQKKRCSILSQYLPKYVRPMECMDQVGESVRYVPRDKYRHE